MQASAPASWSSAQSNGGLTPNEKTSSVRYVGVGVRRAVTSRSDLGVRVEMDDFDGMTALGVQTLDYRYKVSLCARRFLRSYAFGRGHCRVQLLWRHQCRDILPRFDLTLDLRVSTRSPATSAHERPSQQHLGRCVYTFYGASAYLSYRF